MPILTDSTGKQYERSEAQIERMSAPPITLPYKLPKKTPEEEKKEQEENEAWMKKKGYDQLEDYKIQFRKEHQKKKKSIKKK